MTTKTSSRGQDVPWDDTMETGSLESESLLSSAKSTEILSCLWYNVAEFFLNAPG